MISRYVVAFVGVVRPLSVSAQTLDCGWSRLEPAVKEIKIGVLAHDVGKLWSHLRREAGVDYNAELMFGKASCQLFGGTLRPNFGASINDNGDTNKLYAGIILEWEHERTFVNIGLGAALHDGALRTREEDKKELGSRVLFRIPFEFGVMPFSKEHRISVMFDHVSNAYLADPNEGLDTIGLRYGYRF